MQKICHSKEHIKSLNEEGREKIYFLKTLCQGKAEKTLQLNLNL